MYDFKASLKSQLDRLWLAPEDLARGLGIRVPSVRSWLDPDDETALPAKQAFDWIEERVDELDGLLDERLDEADRTVKLHGVAVLPWFRDTDIKEGEFRGTQNLATQLAVKHLENKGFEVQIVFAERSDEWVERHLDDAPDADVKAVWAYRLDALGLTAAHVALGLGVSKRSVKEWRNPKYGDRFPPADAWRFVEDIEQQVADKAIESLKTVEGSKLAVLTYHPADRLGQVGLADQIENRAALKVGSAIMDRDTDSELQYRFE